MPISLDELNTAVDWSKTTEGVQKSPTPAVPETSTPASVSIPLDEVNAFSEHIVTTKDAPKSFWQRRFSDARVAFDSTPHAVGSALIYLGDTMRGREALPINVTQDEPFLKDFEANLTKAVASDKGHAGKGFRELIGTSLIKMGLSWQDLSEKLALEHSKGAEPTSTTDQYLSDATKLTTGMAGLIGIGFVAGPTVAAGSFIGPTTFDTYTKARLKGKDYEDATKIAGAMGVATGVPAFLGLGMVLKLHGPLIEQIAKASLIGGVDLTVMRGGSETVERVSGITDSQKKGWDSVSEAIGLAVRDGSMGAILGPATGGISFAMQKRAEVQERLRSIGVPDEQATKMTDAAFSKGMDTVLSAVEQEKALIENKIFRNENGDFVDPQGKPVASERVLAILKTGDFESLPLVEKAKVLAAEALPQRETVGVTPAEKIFLTEPPTKLNQELPREVVNALFDKYVKIEAKLKQPVTKVKAQITAIQKEVQDFINEKDLGLSDKAKFLSSIKNIQTVQQLRRVLPVLGERIAQLKEKSNLNEQIARFGKLTQKSEIAKTRPEFQKDIIAIADSLSSTKLSVPKAMKLEALAQHLKDNPDSVIPDAKIKELEALNKKSLRDMTSQEVQLINDAIEHLYKLNELKTKIIEKNKYVSTEKVIKEVVDNIVLGSVKKSTKEDVVSGLETSLSRADMVKNYLTLDSRDAETNLMMVEGKDGGVFQSVVFGGLNRAKTDYLRFLDVGQKLLRDGVEGLDVSSWSQYIEPNPKKLDMLEFEFTGGKDPQKVELTKAQALAFHLLMQREEGARHILEGGISFRGKLDNIIKVTAEDAVKVSDVVLSGPDMLKVAINLDAYFNGFQKHAINKTSKALTGLEVAQTPNYFRIKVNQLARTEAPTTRRYLGKVALEGMGFLQPTVNSKLPIILEDAFQVAYESLHLAGAYVSYAEPLRAAKEVLKDPRVKQEMERQGRSEYLKSFDRYIQRVEGNIVDMSNLEALSRDLLVKIQTSVLMLNPGILLKQPTSVLAAMTEMDAKILLKNYTLSPTKVEVSEISQWSPQLAARWQGHITRELGELKNVGAIGNLFTKKIGWTDKFMTAYQMADHPMVGTIWRAAKEEISTNHPELTGKAYFEKVAERAEFVMRRTQASVFMEHRSEILGDRSWINRTVSLFSSETNKQFAMVSRALESYNRSDKTISNKLDLGRKLFIITYLNSVLIATINAGVNVWKQSVDKGRKHEDDLDAELIAKKFVTDVVLGPLGMIYGVRDMVNVIQSVLVYGNVTHEINNPIASLFTNIAMGVGNLLKSGEEFMSGEKFKKGSKKNKEKWTDTAKNAIMQLITGIGSAAGLPVNNVLQYGAPMFYQVEKFFSD